MIAGAEGHFRLATIVVGVEMRPHLGWRQRIPVAWRARGSETGQDGGVCAGSWRHGLLRGEQADEDQPPLTVRADRWLDRRHERLGGWLDRSTGQGMLRQVRLGRRLELQHLPPPSGVVALHRMPQAAVADLVEAARQHMLKEAAHERLAAEPAGSSPTGLAILVLDPDRLVVEADDAGVGERDPEDVAGEIVEHRLFTIAPGADVKDPRLLPDRVRDDEIRALLPQQGAELAAHQLGERLDRQEERPPRRMPGAAVLGDPTAADQAVHVRVEV